MIIKIIALNSFTIIFLFRKIMKGLILLYSYVFFYVRSFIYDCVGVVMSVR